MWNDRVIIHWLCRSVVLCFLTRGLWTNKRCSKEKQSGMRKGTELGAILKVIQIKKRRKKKPQTKIKETTFVERPPWAGWGDATSFSTLRTLVVSWSPSLKRRRHRRQTLQPSFIIWSSQIRTASSERGWKQISSGGFISQMSCWHFVRASISYINTHTHTRMHVCMYGSLGLIGLTQ